MDGMTGSYDVPAIRAKLRAKMGESSSDYPVCIEQRFPRILDKIAELWGTAALDSYLDGLMLNDRDGRQGFPPEVAMELFHLTSMHEALGLSRKAGAFGWSGVSDADQEKKGIR